MLSFLATDDTSSEATDHASVSLQDRGSITVPEQFLADWGIAFVIFVGSCLYLRLFYDYTTLFSDEGIVLEGADRILRGQVVYRDFFSLLTPGSYYWMALLFRVFGNSIVVARAALVVYGAIFAVLTYLIARRVCSRWLSLTVAYLVTITCLPYYFMALHNWDSTLWAYLALYGAVRCLESRHWLWPGLTGSFAALTCLFEQSKGAGIVFGLGLGFLLIAARGGCQQLAKRSHWISLMGGFVWPPAATFGYFGARHGLSQMLADCLWPLHHYSGINKAFYGDAGLRISDLYTLLSGSRPLGLIAIFTLSPYFIIPVLPILAVGFFSAGFVWLRRREEPREIAQYYLLVSTTLIGLLLSTLATGRPDLIHLMFQTPLFLLVLAWGLGGRYLRLQLLDIVAPVTWLVTVVSFTAFGLALLSAPLNAHFALRTRRGLLRAGGPDAILEELQSRVRAGTKVFVYPKQPLYYYLAACDNPTRYDWLFPGMYPPEQFKAAFGELDADRTSLVLFEPSFVEKLPASRSSMPVQVLAAQDAGEEYIFAHYRSCKILRSIPQFTSFAFMVRKDLSCSGSF